MTLVTRPKQHPRAIFEEMEEMFDDIFKDSPLRFIRAQNEGYPVSNILVNKDGDFRIEVAVTGFEQDDISVALDERILIIRGGIKEESNQDQDNSNFHYLHRRIKKSQFEKRFSIPKELDVKKIEVKNKNGLLIIEIPFDKERSTEQQLLIKTEE